MDNSELLVQIQQMMTGLESRMTEKMDSLETRMTEKIETSIQESEARMSAKIETSIQESENRMKAYIDQNNVVIGEMMTKELERVTQAVEHQKIHLADLEKIVQKNLYDIALLKDEVAKLKQKGA